MSTPNLILAALIIFLLGALFGLAITAKRD